MSAQQAQYLIKRVAVVLDASMQSHQALLEAAELAASMQAELEGVFVEDINLIHLAELPFTREIRPASMTLDTFDPGRMKRELRSLARQEQYKLESIARDRGIAHSFRIRRGSVRTEVMATVTEVDVLTLCRSGPQVTEKLQQHKTTSVDRLTHFPALQARPVVSVIFGGADNETRALASAAQLAERLDLDICVLLAGGCETDRETQRHEADKLLTKQNQRFKYIRVAGDTVSDLLNAMGPLKNRALVVSSNNSLVSNGKLWQYLEQASCPLFIVR